MMNTKLLRVLLASLMLGAGAISSAKDLQGGAVASSSKNLPSGAAIKGGAVTVHAANSIAAEPGTIAPDFKLNVPVRLTDMHPTLPRAVVYCAVFGPEGHGVFGENEIEVPLRAGDYNGTLAVPIRNGIRQRLGGREERLSDRRTGRAPDPGLASSYGCWLYLRGSDGLNAGFCDSTSMSACLDKPWAVRKAGTPHNGYVTGSIQ
jgi:hypothetical protein